MADDRALPPAQALTLAQRLIDDGRPFHAHEVLEATWKAGGPDRRGLWKGLAQIAVGLTHARRGNQRGAVALLRRGAEAVAADTDGPARQAGLDAAALAARTRELADRIEQTGLAALSEDDFRLRLMR